ncbi:MAG: class I SAM-dependent methyltransferase [Calditrichia bacterium]|nr:class I SAM-dependent methyltransferase [Calditrichia bacterium]
MENPLGKMNNIIKNNIVYLEDVGVWKLQDEENFNYSDGTEEENFVLKTIENAKDLSSDSIELEKTIKDWPSEYHLSRERAQLLKGFNFNENIKNVLEIGCGCGAITRFLGETLKDSAIIAVEGSLKRATIARKRTRGLKNVEVISAPFNKVEFNIKFDLIVCVGVFEYSSTFIDDESPYESVMEYFSNALSTEGTLIIAIENQFGLKYFAGATEDHTRIHFEGIEGYPGTKGKPGRTFGKRYLESMLKAQDLNNIRWFFPFPDYKLPGAIISENTLNSSNKNFGGLPSKNASRDYFNLHKHYFSEKLAWWEIGKSLQIPEFTNSFLILASKNNNKNVSASWDAIVFSNGRRNEYQTKTLFYDMDKNNSLVKKENVFNIHCNHELVIQNLEEQKWVTGTPLHIHIIKALRESDKDLETLKKYLNLWKGFLESHMDNKENGLIPGNMLDAMPWNLIEVEPGKIIIIDKEWVLRKPISLKTLIIRGLFFLFRDEEVLSMTLKSYPFKKLKQLIINLCSLISIKCKAKDIKDFVNFEAKFVSIIMPETETNLYNSIFSELNKKITKK